MNNMQVKIIVAEDESIIALDIKKTLEQLGYNVLAVVNNGNDVIKEVEIERPDLVLMDILLNGRKTGIEVAQQIYSEHSIPVVYLTALTDEETLQMAKKTEPFGYILKPFDEKSLRANIETALNKYSAEAELKKKSGELKKEKLKNEKLLRKILPEEIISELKNRGVIAPRLYDNISILFTDFQAETAYDYELSPEVLITELNDIFSSFDVIIKRHKLEKLKTSVDKCLICGGIPAEPGNHAAQIILAALDMQKFLSARNKYSEFTWTMRAGVNSGQVVAGILGYNKGSFDIWGEAVNIASRMEASAELGKINISRSTYNLVKDYFDCEYRGKIVIKGKGKIDMYYVTGVKEHLMN